MTITRRIKKSKKELNSDEKPENKDKDASEAPRTFRYGPMPTFSNQRVWSRLVIILGLLIYVWYSTKENQTTLAKQKEIVAQRGQNIDCDPKYLSEIAKFERCAPKKCGRYVSDKIVTNNEAEILLNVAKRGLVLGGSNGGASILDLHSGALSYGDKFINIYTMESQKKIISNADLAVYQVVKNKIQKAISDRFGINSDDLYLTHPTFFSKLTNADAKTIHDEYWHVHIDKETYESFHYTSLLYLNDFGVDFKGGRFFFVNQARNVSVEPRKGRVSMFTSGGENPHFVEKVLSGTRFAITVSFTCDKSKSISDSIVPNK